MFCVALILIALSLKRPSLFSTGLYASPQKEAAVVSILFCLSLLAVDLIYGFKNKDRLQAINICCLWYIFVDLSGIMLFWFLTFFTTGTAWHLRYHIPWLSFLLFAVSVVPVYYLAQKMIKKREAYFSAQWICTPNASYVEVRGKLSYEQALERLRQNQDVFASTQKAACRLCSGWGDSVSPVLHPAAQEAGHTYPHMHLCVREQTGAVIWFRA